MLTVQGKDYSQYLTNRQPRIARTYKGDILRSQTGQILQFPLSFITVGFELTFLGPRAVMDELQQLLLSSNLVEVAMKYPGTDIKGKFSATSTATTEIKDKGERHKELTVSLVSDGGNITKSNGQAFTVRRNGATILSTAYYGKVYTIPGGGKLNGAALPNNELLVLGDTDLTT